MIKLYTFHRGLDDKRSDIYKTRGLISKLVGAGYDVDWKDLNGEDKFKFKDVLIDQGSITIIEFEENGEFKLVDNGDAPLLSYELCKKEGFSGAVIGQFNREKWKCLLPDSHEKVVPGNYQETYWCFGKANVESVVNYRNEYHPSDSLYFRGSTYSGHPNPKYRDIRNSLHILKQLDTRDKFNFYPHPISFMQYIQEALKYKMVISMGGGGGVISGDLCFRDIEMFGLGIPVIRPRLAVETMDPLIADEHYISVDVEFTEEGKYKDHRKLAVDLLKKYSESVENPEMLNRIARNALTWYHNNYDQNKYVDDIIKGLSL